MTEPPLSGMPEEIAAGLHAYADASASHLQIWLEPITPAGIEAFAPVLELRDQTWLNAITLMQATIRGPGRMISGPSTTKCDKRDEPSQAIFHQAWQIYRTLIDENYIFHREAYACLHQILVEEAVQPFRFLDIACGDATASVSALTGTRIESYHGIDLSAAALALAREPLSALDCPVTLEQADFVTALRERRELVDVVWIGLSLHHLQTPEKLAVLRDIRGILGEGGLLVLYEIASPDGEDRAGWLRRWDCQEPAWTAYTPEGWETMRAHVHAADFPETSSRWLALGFEAGFDESREVFTAPSNLLRLYSMRAGATEPLD